MKKMWKVPQMDILDIRMTENGPGNANPDCYDASEGRQETHEGMSNANCPGGPGGGNNFQS